MKSKYKLIVYDDDGMMLFEGRTPLDCMNEYVAGDKEWYIGDFITHIYPWSTVVCNQLNFKEGILINCEDDSHITNWETNNVFKEMEKFETYKDFEKALAKELNEYELENKVESTFNFKVIF